MNQMLDVVSTAIPGGATAWNRSSSSAAPVNLQKNEWYFSQSVEAPGWEFYFDFSFSAMSFPNLTAAFIASVWSSNVFIDHADVALLQTPRQYPSCLYRPHL